MLMASPQNRWLLVDVTFESASGGVPLPSSTLTLLRTIRSSLQDNFGDVAAGALGGTIAIKYYSASTHTAIVRCSRVGVKEVWGALTLCNEWEGTSIRMVALHCGGEYHHLVHCQADTWSGQGSDSLYTLQVLSEKCRRQRYASIGDGSKRFNGRKRDCSR